MPSSTKNGRRRTTALALLLSLGTGLLTACQKPTSDGPMVRIGYSAWPGWFPWAVTEAKGLFGKAGVNAKMQWFDGYLDSINALNAGQLDCNTTCKSAPPASELIVSFRVWLLQSSWPALRALMLSR